MASVAEIRLSLMVVGSLPISRSTAVPKRGRAKFLAKPIYRFRSNHLEA
jgi:hypothetical protein